MVTNNMEQRQETNNTQETQLKEEMDLWVKDFEKKISRTNDNEQIIKENTQNIDYNYELIKEMKTEIESLKKEITKLKHANYIAMNSRPIKDITK